MVHVILSEGNIRMQFDTQTLDRFEEIGTHLFAGRSTFTLLAPDASKIWVDDNLVKDNAGAPTHVIVRQVDGLTSKPIPPRPGQVYPQAQAQQRQQPCA